MKVGAAVRRVSGQQSCGFQVESSRFYLKRSETYETQWWARSEVDDDQAVVVGVEREEAGGGGAVHRALQGGDGVATQGDVDDFLVEDDGRGGVDGIDGDVHILLVGVQEDVAVRVCVYVFASGRLDAVDEAAVDRGEAGEGVEALATGRIGDAYRIYRNRLQVGGFYTKPAVDAVECGVDVHRTGACDVDRLRGHESLTHLVNRVRSFGHTIESEWIVAAIGKDFHGIAAHRQREVEFTEGGKGRAVGTQLGGAVGEDSGTVVEGQCDSLHAAVCCQRLVLGRGLVAIYHFEIAQRDMDGCQYHDVVLLASGNQKQGGKQWQQSLHGDWRLKVHVEIVKPRGLDSEVAADTSRID